MGPRESWMLNRNHESHCHASVKESMVLHCLVAL